MIPFKLKKENERDLTFKKLINTLKIAVFKDVQRVD